MRFCQLPRTLIPRDKLKSRRIALTRALRARRARPPAKLFSCFAAARGCKAARGAREGLWLEQDQLIRKSKRFKTTFALPDVAAGQATSGKNNVRQRGAQSFAIRETTRRTRAAHQNLKLRALDFKNMDAIFHESSATIKNFTRRMLLNKIFSFHMPSKQLYNSLNYLSYIFEYKTRSIGSLYGWTYVS